MIRMQRKSLFLIALYTLLLSLFHYCIATAQGNEAVNLEKLGIEIKVPEGWQVVEASQAEQMDDELGFKPIAMIRRTELIEGYFSGIGIGGSLSYKEYLGLNNLGGTLRDLTSIHGWDIKEKNDLENLPSLSYVEHNVGYDTLNCFSKMGPRRYRCCLSIPQSPEGISVQEMLTEIANISIIFNNPSEMLLQYYHMNIKLSNGWKWATNPNSSSIIENKNDPNFNIEIEIYEPEKSIRLREYYDNQIKLLVREEPTWEEKKFNDIHIGDIPALVYQVTNHTDGVALLWIVTVKNNLVYLINIRVPNDKTRGIEQLLQIIPNMFTLL